MTRVYNFSAGPAAIPDPVLQRIREDIPDWAGTGMSVMEVSHRSREFVDLAATAERNLRKLLTIPDNYSVLFLQGGATLQFAMVPLNLTSDGDVVDYVQTGSWSKNFSKSSKIVTPKRVDIPHAGATLQIPKDLAQNRYPAGRVGR